MHSPIHVLRSFFNWNPCSPTLKESTGTVEVGLNSLATRKEKTRNVLLSREEQQVIFSLTPTKREGHMINQVIGVIEVQLVLTSSVSSSLQCKLGFGG